MAKSIWDFGIALIILLIGTLFIASGVFGFAGVVAVFTGIFIALR